MKVSFYHTIKFKFSFYEIEWNSSNYPGGVYFYQLNAKEFVETKKMILLDKTGMAGFDWMRIYYKNLRGTL